MRRSIHRPQSEEHAGEPKSQTATCARFDHKVAVLGALQRDGDVRLEVCRDKKITREVLHSFIKAKLAEDTDLIVTDENNQYEGIADANTRHETVSHTQKEWVRGVVHTNGLEGVWSLF